MSEHGFLLWKPKTIADYLKSPCGGSCHYAFCFGRIDNYLGWQCSHGIWYTPKPLYPNHRGVSEPITAMEHSSWGNLLYDELEEEQETQPIVPQKIAKSVSWAKVK